MTLGRLTLVWYGWGWLLERGGWGCWLGRARLVVAAGPVTLLWSRLP